ncbi:VWA domain-containing protein [Bacteroidetes/Chlorobi group bacterium Naka2016]|jgi:Ca-activated chloride channel family protein|nr:MAG: VWA domain-containing protein [Bacteroidetes/Chlorobi group bacterium Naka2016]
MNFGNYHFANPEFFWLLALIPILVIWYYFKHRTIFVPLKFSSLEGFQKTKPNLKVRLRHLPFALRLLALVFFIIALARPQTSSSEREIETEGIDIVITLDISGSMLAEDFKPNRLEAAKRITEKFIDARKNDRIGLVIFSAKSFTQCPITIDHAVLKNLLKQIKSGLIEDGTAIGMGLATAVDRLKDSKAKSRVVILLTDGINNTGIISPLTAAELAKNFGIRVYTIGVGTIGKAPYPFQTPFGIQYMNVDVEIDEPLLKDIANATGGKYFRATDNKSLEKIYNEIDSMEKTKIKQTVFTLFTDKHFPFVLAGALILMLEILLRLFVFRKIP